VLEQTETVIQPVTLEVAGSSPVGSASSFNDSRSSNWLSANALSVIVRVKSLASPQSFCQPDCILFWITSWIPSRWLP